jgi:hypothetical protein
MPGPWQKLAGGSNGADEQTTNPEAAREKPPADDSPESTEAGDQGKS